MNKDAKDLLTALREDATRHILRPKRSETLCGARGDNNSVKAIAVTYMTREQQDATICPECLRLYREEVKKAFKRMGRR